MADTSSFFSAETLDAWVFNVGLECIGREEEEVAICVGGAVLDLRDLNRILRWVMAHE